MQTIDEMHMANDAEANQRIGEVFKTMLAFTVMMVLGPISTYFLSKNYVWENIFQISPTNSYIYSAISAVVVVHIIVGGFIYLAWKDAFQAAKVKKQD